MRASQLYQFSELDVGIPKRAPELKDGGVTLVEPIKEATPSREAAVAPPSMLPINVPAGWKKGMTMELFEVVGRSDQSVVVERALERRSQGGRESRRSSATACGASSAGESGGSYSGEVCAAGYNPDEDEYSSDYSSEVGSSKEDDED